MKRSEIRDFLKNGVTKINPSLHFGSGRISEWVSAGNKNFKQVWWESNVEASVELANQTLPVTTHNIRLHIAGQDKADASATDYEAVIDDCDYIAQQLIYQYNQVIEDHAQVSIEGISREPFVKKYGNPVMSGVTLSFNLRGPDKTKLC